MSAVDFESWAAPDLQLTFRGRTYTVAPPSVADARKILAAAVRGEVNLGLVKGEIPEAVQRVLDTIEPDDHPALGAAYGEMSDAGVPAVTIDRMAYYAVFFWARGKEYADGLAALLWTPPPAGSEGGGDADPKGSSRRRTGRPTAKASPTPTDGTPRTVRSRKR